MQISQLARESFARLAGSALFGANSLLGNEAYNLAGEELGEIKEFMIDVSSGQVSYAVLSVGGVLGLGNKLFAVPWAALRHDSVNQHFWLDVSTTALDDAAGFNKACWPSGPEKAWAKPARQYRDAPYYPAT